MTARVPRTVGDLSVDAGRGPGQLPWYEYASRFVMGKTVLDAGCGLGKGLEILKRSARTVIGQDLDARLANVDILIKPLSDFPSKSVDVVTSIDVIEHVEDDKGFVAQLCRIARKKVFITTPNWTITRCTWPYHLREYTPSQLEALLAPFGSVQLFKGNSSGTEVYPVQNAALYHWANWLRAAPPSAFPTRCVNRLLPRSWQIHGHNAALLDL